jgi:hypothetical protein
MDYIFQSAWMYVLAIIIAILAAILIRFIVVGLERRHPKTEQPKPAAARAPSKPSPASPSKDAAPQDDVAAIAAAVYAVLGAHRIIRIEPSETRLTWAAQGRWLHQTSRRARS